MPSLYESVFLVLVVLTAVAVFVSWPFLIPLRRKARGDSPATGKASTLAALEERHQQIVAALRDLDFDHDLGKVTAEDYAVARAQLMSEGADVLRALDAATPAGGRAAARDGSGDVEREIAARRKRKAETRAASGPVATHVQSVCPQCGRPSTSDDVFCPRCGTRLSEKKVVA